MNYTAANTDTITTHLAGIGTALAGAGADSTDDLTSDHTGVNYTGALNASLTTHLSGIDTALAGKLVDVSDDGSPQLSGDLDLNGRDIITTNNADLDLAPHGTGAVARLGNTTGGNNQGALQLKCENNTHYVELKSPAHASFTGASYTLTLPPDDGDLTKFSKQTGQVCLTGLTKYQRVLTQQMT